MKNHKTLPSLSLVFLDAVVLHTTNKKGPLSTEYISLILESYLWNAYSLYFWAEKPLYKKLFLNSQ